MKKLIILFLFLLFFSHISYALTVDIVSDSHIVSDKAENKITPSIKNLLKAVEDINSDSSDYVVFLGDNVQSANKTDTVMFAKIADTIKKPFFVIIGNRDVSKTKGVTKKEYFRLVNKFSSNKTKNVPSYKVYGDIVFVFMNGVNETFPLSSGYYKEAELVFLDKTLTKFKDKKAVIFQHFPIVPPENDEFKDTHKKEEYKNVLAKHNNVVALVSGHYHKEGVFDTDGVKHISAGALVDNGEYEQIKFFKNNDGSYSLTAKVLSVGQENYE